MRLGRAGGKGVDGHCVTDAVSLEESKVPESMVLTFVQHGKCSQHRRLLQLLLIV